MVTTITTITATTATSLPPGHRDHGGVRIPRKRHHHHGNLSEGRASVTGEGVGKSRRYYWTKKVSKSSDRASRTGNTGCSCGE